MTVGRPSPRRWMRVELAGEDASRPDSTKPRTEADSDIVPSLGMGTPSGLPRGEEYLTEEEQTGQPD